MQDGAKEGKRIAVVDLDGCIRDDKHRASLLPSDAVVKSYDDKPNLAFKSYHMACHGDVVVQETVDMVNKLYSEGYFIIILTSCTGYFETINITCTQLKEWRLKWNTMVMRHPDNHNLPHDMKLNFMRQMVTEQEDKNRFVFIDDSAENVDTIKEFGIDTVLVKVQ
ncbi:polynucleotide kinase/phosphorylase [Colwellia phage 9A]|uniref:Polynucleotide kinase/phosphorylase n=1 Tax=Colwellia phage 9A TaxID=765765 RepID=I3UMB3_9CAUD|nr:polynucleotide kinase/phosphorylase [Colwellia phage 9A]AFK66628.1 polynucleotide kinase/phosphorylase [Colwellia phage 9A]